MQSLFITTPQNINKLLLKLAPILFVCVVFSYSSYSEARTRTFCGVVKRDCGGHLQPQCSSGSICDAGFKSWPINVKINCPWPIKDQTITQGCYDNRPSCDDCSASGQIPCPEEAAAFCTVGCDPGLVKNSTTQLCGEPGSTGIPPGKIGATCGPGFPCSSGLACDETQLKCVGKSQAKQSCANPFVPCDDGLSCTLSLECSHSPARISETCDFANPCGEGMFCQAGIPQRCKPYRKVGEGCSAFNPCEEGASCEACFVAGCNAPLQCFPNSNNGALSEQQCRKLYSPSLARDVANSAINLTHSYGSGVAIAAVEGIVREVGNVYSPNGRYGCYETVCDSVGIDIGAGAYGVIGFFEGFEDAGGASFTIYQEVSAFEVVSFNTSQILAANPLPRNPITGKIEVEIDSPVRLIGTQDAFGLGVPSPLPAAGGVAMCETTLDEIIFEQAEPITIQPIPPQANLSDDTPGPAPGSGALWFDGVDDKIILSDSDAINLLTFSESFSASLWMSPAKVDPETLSLLSKEGEYQIGLINGQLAYTIANTQPGWRWVTTGYYPPVNQWTHITLTYNASVSETPNLLVYINGQLAHELEGIGNITDRHEAEDQLQLGGRQLSSEPEVFAGRIDELRLWQRAISAEEASDLILPGSLPAAEGLVASWDFDSFDNASAAANEGPGFSLAAASEDSQPQQSDDNRRSPALLLFDGSQHVAAVSNTPLANLAKQTAFTFEAWVYPTAAQAPGASFFASAGALSLGMNEQAQITFELANTDPGWQLIDTEMPLPLDAWSHLAMVYDLSAAKMSLLLNGAVVYETTMSGEVEDTDISDDLFTIGKGFKGAIDEVRLWSQALSSEEIARRYRQPILNNQDDSLQLYWKFDERETRLVFDLSNNNILGNLGGVEGLLSPERVDAASFPGYVSSLLGDVCAQQTSDEDEDGVCDAGDNCPYVSNSDQQDSNDDGLGDACTSENNTRVTISNTPLENSRVNSGASKVVMLRFSIENTYAGSQMDSLNLNASGSGDVSKINAVTLWRDIDANGEVNEGDLNIGSGSFNENNRRLSLSPEERYLLPAGSSHYLVTYDF